MNAREAKSEYQNHQLTVEQLFELLERQEQTIRRLEAEIRRLKQRLAQYEPEVEREPDAANSSPAGSVNFSLQAEEKRRLRRQRQKRKKSPGRRSTELKFADATQFEDIYPPDADHRNCTLFRQRAVWRLREGRGVLVGYNIYRESGGDEPRIPGVTPRSEYGIEILVVLSYLVYIIGISQEKACKVLNFFCQLPLSRSQADSLLRQLARYWEPEFETLCDLLSSAAVVYLDETGWKVGNESPSWKIDSAGFASPTSACSRKCGLINGISLIWRTSSWIA